MADASVATDGRMCCRVKSLKPGRKWLIAVFQKLFLIDTKVWHPVENLSLTM